MCVLDTTDHSRPYTPLFFSSGPTASGYRQRCKVCKSRTSGSSTHSQKFKTKMVVNDYNMALAVARVRVLGVDQNEKRENDDRREHLVDDVPQHIATHVKYDSIISDLMN